MANVWNDCVKLFRISYQHILLIHFGNVLWTCERHGWHIFTYPQFCGLVFVVVAVVETIFRRSTFWHLAIRCEWYLSLTLHIIVRYSIGWELHEETPVIFRWMALKMERNSWNTIAVHTKYNLRIITKRMLQNEERKKVDKSYKPFVSCLFEHASYILFCVCARVHTYDMDYTLESTILQGLTMNRSQW